MGSREVFLEWGKFSYMSICCFTSHLHFFARCMMLMPLLSWLYFTWSVLVFRAMAQLSCVTYSFASTLIWFLLSNPLRFQCPVGLLEENRLFISLFFAFIVPFNYCIALFFRVFNLALLYISIKNHCNCRFLKKCRQTVYRLIIDCRKNI